MKTDIIGGGQVESREFVKHAAQFAARAHKGQSRKYTGKPYIVHPAEVAGIIKLVPHTPAMLAAAWLHDVVEDCGVTVKELEVEFNMLVAGYVEWLSDATRLSDGNRAKRKQIECERIAHAPSEVKTIKLADLISNTSSIVEHDRNFARVYLVEKRELLKVLIEGNADLWLVAQMETNFHIQQLGI